MLATDVDVQNTPSVLGCSTLLHRAAGLWDVELAQELIERGADLNIRGQALDWGGNCAVMVAASHGDEHMVRMLLDRGASVEGAASAFGNILQTVCYLGHANVLKVFLAIEPSGLDWEIRAASGHDLLSLAAQALTTPWKKFLEQGDNAEVVRLLTTRLILHR